VRVLASPGEGSVAGRRGPSPRRIFARDGGGRPWPWRSRQARAAFGGRAMGTIGNPGPRGLSARLAPDNTPYPDFLTHP